MLQKFHLPHSLRLRGCQGERRPLPRINQHQHIEALHAKRCLLAVSHHEHWICLKMDVQSDGHYPVEDAKACKECLGVDWMSLAAYKWPSAMEKPGTTRYEVVRPSDGFEVLLHSPSDLLRCVATTDCQLCAMLEAEFRGCMPETAIVQKQPKKHRFLSRLSFRRNRQSEVIDYRDWLRRPDRRDWLWGVRVVAGVHGGISSWTVEFEFGGRPKDPHVLAYCSSGKSIGFTCYKTKCEIFPSLNTEAQFDTADI